MRKSIALLLLFLGLFSSISFAQFRKNINQLELDTGTIEQQFDYIISKSTTYKEFQLIRRNSILKVKAHANDTINAITQELKKVSTEANASTAKIKKLAQEVTALQLAIDTANEEIDSISFLGIPLSKTSYNLIVWSIIILLLLGLTVIALRYKNNNLSTKKTKYELEKTIKEFEVFRKKSLKKEQEIMRKLQDEINKHNP